MKVFRFEWIKKETKEVLGGLCRAEITDDLTHNTELDESYFELMDAFNRYLPVPPFRYLANHNYSTRSYFTECGLNKYRKYIERVIEALTKNENELYALKQIEIVTDELEIIYDDEEQVLIKI